MADETAREALRGWLTDERRTAAWLSDELGVHAQAVYGWLAGRWVPSPAHAEAIETLTGVSAVQWQRDRLLARLGDLA